MYAQFIIWCIIKYMNKNILIALLLVTIAVLTYLQFKQKDEVLENTTPVVDVQTNKSTVTTPVKIQEEIKTEKDAQKKFTSLGYAVKIEDIRYFDTTNPLLYPGIPTGKLLWAAPVSEMQVNPTDKLCSGKYYLFIDTKTGTVQGKYFVTLICA